MDDATVMQLVSRVLDSGCTPEDACRDSPELLTSVREQLLRIQSLDEQVEELFPRTESALLDEARPSHPVENLPHVPGHEVLSVLGHGGMGVVYKARHLKLHRTVAVKMLLGGAHTDSAGLKRLLREAEAVAALRHPNIVQVHEVGDHDGLPYFTMELVEGGSLREKLKERVLDSRDAASLVSTLAEAMEVAHASGIIHRDLKPANVLLTPDGVPKIVDFGLARWIDVESSLTLTGAPLGTPSYMAPEQARGGSQAIGPAADVYALGAILYATLTGRPPFQSDVPAVTLLQVIKNEPVRPSRLNPRVPRDLETICLKCLSKDPKRRYVTATALAADLQRFLRGEPIFARPVGLLERTGKWMRRRPAHATIVAGSVLAVLSLVGAGLWLGLKRHAIERAAEDDLLEVDRAAAAADWSGARIAVERARARLADGGSVDLLAEVEQGTRELDLVETLEKIWLIRADVTPGTRKRRDNSRVDAAYEQAFSAFGLVDVHAHPREVASRVESSRIRSVLVSALDTWATCVSGDDSRRDGLLEAVRLADPDPTGWRDRVRDPPNWNDQQALTELASSAPVSEESVMLLLVLAEHLFVAGGDSIPFLEKIQQTYPNDFWSNSTLAARLADTDDKAPVRYFQAAVALRPDSPYACANLGSALGAAGELEAAKVQFRKALLLEPGYRQAHFGLCSAFAIEGRHAEAVEELRTALRLDASQPDTANRCILVGWLLDLGRLDESIAESREALRLDPRSFDVHLRLGYALHAAGLLDESCDVLREAIAIDARSEAHEVLGTTLADMGRIDDAIASLRESVRLDPRRAVPWSELVASLIACGRLEEARTAAERFLESRPEDDPGRLEAKTLREHCDLVHALAASVPAILDGTRVPKDRAECLAFADMFRGRQDHAAAARYFADAFDRERGPLTWERTTFDAARCAALAGALGEGAGDAAGAEERARWRSKALAWLRVGLEALETRFTSGAPRSRLDVQWDLMEMKAEPAFVELRDAAQIERLPEDERAQWRALWAEVDSMSARAKSVR